MTSFTDLGLSEVLLRAVAAEGYTVPTPIQAQAVPHVLAGRDLLGCAQTGTGKTAAFALPILHRLHEQGNQSNRHGRRARVLVLSPTRELASQIGESFATYGRHTRMRSAIIFGGVNQNRQTKALQAGVDIIIATPGRLQDLMQQGFVDLRSIEVFVLDEADRMLDMGFIPDIRRIIAKLPAQRQTLFFSATMPPDIRKLSAAILRDPVPVEVARTSSAAETVEHSVYHVAKNDKPALLQHFLRNTAASRVLVFTRTKHGADKVARQLAKFGMRAEAIHGNKSQGARQRALESFKSDRPPVLVATDVAARGLDIDEVSHVVNYDLPNVPETYVHRIGRTGRAGASGLAVSFCSPEELEHLRDIEKLLRKSVPVIGEKPKLPPPQQSGPKHFGTPKRSKHKPSHGGHQRSGHQQGVQTHAARESNQGKRFSKHRRRKQRV